ncbi:SVM family protein [Saccharicrinis sp. FJH54]
MLKIILFSFLSVWLIINNYKAQI